MGYGLSASFSKSQSKTTANATTHADARNRGGSNKVTIVGDAPGTIPPWLLVAAVAMVFLVVIAMIFAL